MSEEHVHTPSGCNIPEDAIFYKNCGCSEHMKQPQKIGTFNLETNILSVGPTGEF